MQILLHPCASEPVTAGSAAVFRCVFRKAGAKGAKGAKEWHTSRAAAAPRAPMAMPTSAAASAGASFTPSPTTTTGPLHASLYSATCQETLGGPQNTVQRSANMIVITHPVADDHRRPLARLFVLRHPSASTHSTTILLKPWSDVQHMRPSVCIPS